MSATRDHRGTILVEPARLIRRREWPAGQYEFRLQAPGIAARALAGSFVHLQCDPLLPMRRPMSLMAVDPEEGWVDILFKVHGHGTALLARHDEGDELSLIGPIGVPFRQSGYRPRPLLIGGGVGIPPMVFLA
ncbi:MAG: dihydroorotate dehydrogenase electron transfer subunit, partial [Gammaproteobacteria bacterium]